MVKGAESSFNLVALPEENSAIATPTHTHARMRTRSSNACMRASGSRLSGRSVRVERGAPASWPRCGLAVGSRQGPWGCGGAVANAVAQGRSRDQRFARAREAFDRVDERLAARAGARIRAGARGAQPVDVRRALHGCRVASGTRTSRRRALALARRARRCAARKKRTSWSRTRSARRTGADEQASARARPTRSWCAQPVQPALSHQTRCERCALRHEPRVARSWIRM